MQVQNNQNNNNQNNNQRGWRQFLPLSLLVALFGYLVINSSAIASLFAADPYVAAIIGAIGTVAVTGYFVYMSKLMANEGKLLENQITNEVTRLGRQLNVQENELGSFGHLPKLANANIASNALSTFAALAKLLPPMQANSQNQYTSEQKAALVAITAMSTATLLFNFSYLTVVGGRNGVLTLRRNELNGQPTPQVPAPAAQQAAAIAPPAPQ